MADNDIRTVDDYYPPNQGPTDFDRPLSPVFVNEDDDEQENDDSLTNALNKELETNQIDEQQQQFGPFKQFEDDNPLPILFSDKRIDVKKPGPRFDVSSNDVL